ncbi:MAG: 16S rRNA (guanine(966)-N(2))-methyltransferase RsmD [Betaproteobacteria bacterium]
MRVVAGRLGGLRLRAVPGRATRPTTDRVKESVFGILGERCEGAIVLDLFAGTGSLGIEALSRGAARVLFVERDPAAVRVLGENLRATGVTGQATVLVKEALAALGLLARKGDGPFDLVFLDPPYGKGMVEAALERLGNGNGLLSPGALVVAEHSNHETPPLELGALSLWRRQRYGETVVSFYRVEGAEGGSGEGGEPAS